MVKALTYFQEATEMVSGSGSGVCQTILFGMELSSVHMRDRLKAGPPQSTVKGLLKQ